MWAILSVFVWLSLRGSPVSSLLIKPEMWVSFVAVRTAREFRIAFLFQGKMTELPSLKLPTWLFLFNNSVQPHYLIFFPVLSFLLTYIMIATMCISIFLCARDTHISCGEMWRSYMTQILREMMTCAATMQCMHIVCRCVPCKLCNQEETLSYHLHLQHSQNL